MADGKWAQRTATPGRMPRQPSIATAPSESSKELGVIADNAFPRLLKIVNQICRADFSGYKRATINRRILRRMALINIENLQEYVSYLEQHRDEVEALYQDFLIDVTRFFRDPEAYDVLKTIAFPTIFRDRAPNDSIRVWVAGCATGEEAYSHAICLFEYLSEIRADVSVQVFGTDINESAIKRARAGVFKESIVADVSPLRLRRFFKKTEGYYQINKAIRDVCIFARQNVLTDPPLSHMDIVSCRNLLIYLGPELQQRLIPILHYALRPNGYLMLGSSEGLVGRGAQLFDPVDAEYRIYARKPVASAVTFDFKLWGPNGQPMPLMHR